MQQQQGPIPGKGMAISSLVLGIIATVFGFFGYYAFIGIILGIVGIVLGAIGGKKMKSVGASSGMATAGLVLSIIGTILSSILFIACAICIAAIDSAVSSLG
jgi:hypothetical protein